MTVAVCISDGGGMMFNKRRQSRDRAVTEDILARAGGRSIITTEYSAKLFSENHDRIFAVAEPLPKAKEGDFVFIEDQSLSEHKNRINEIYIYKWNKKYPFDKRLDFFPEVEGMYLAEVVEFAGNSHEKITRELWKRR